MPLRFEPCLPRHIQFHGGFYGASKREFARSSINVTLTKKEIVSKVKENHQNPTDAYDVSEALTPELVLEKFQQELVWAKALEKESESMVQMVLDSVLDSGSRKASLKAAEMVKQSATDWVLLLEKLLVLAQAKLQSKATAH
jgi:hypothetical protein